MPSPPTTQNISVRAAQEEKSAHKSGAARNVKLSAPHLMEISSGGWKIQVPSRQREQSARLGGAGPVRKRLAQATSIVDATLEDGGELRG